MLTCKACHTFPKRDAPVSAPEGKSGLLNCGRCMWAAYCSQECQQGDWKMHKIECKAIVAGKARGEDLETILVGLSLGSKPNLQAFHRQMLQGSRYFGAAPPTTKTVALERVWGLLAVAASAARENGDFPRHPGLTHRVLKVETVGETGAQIVHLSEDPFTMSTDQAGWYPTAPSAVATSRLMRRILSDRWSLEMAMGLALAVRERMYVGMSTALTYCGEKVSDFGVCAGSIRVASQDRISYRLGKKVLPSSNPADHYWLYFTRPSGEIAYFDPSLFVHNFRYVVDAAPYTPPTIRASVGPSAPGYLFGRLSTMTTLSLHTEREQLSRFSLLCYEGSGQLGSGLTQLGVDRTIPNLERPLSPLAGDSGLMKCSRCKWAEYCNSECQEKDWKKHKPVCKAIVAGKARGEDTVTVLAHLSLGPKPNLKAFHRQMLKGSRYFGAAPPTTKIVALERVWGILAVVANSARMRGDFPMHPALLRKVLRIETVSGTGEKVVHLSEDPHTLSAGPAAWYPTSPSSIATTRLFRRIHSDKWSMETAMGLALAIRERLYVDMSTALTYCGEKVSDFGVCAGSVLILPKDRISYRLGGNVLAGPNPADHYWLYFTLPSGEVTFFDPSLFVYNFDWGVHTFPYTPPSQRHITSPMAPGLLFGRFSIMTTLHLHTERYALSRFSLLCYEGSGELAAGLTTRGVDRDAKA
ncbi:hypothetical protein RQP46_010341 [Phenoliferia psychrophenolica]